MTFDENTVSSASPESVVTDVPLAGIRPGSGLMVRRGLMTAAAVALTAITGIAGVRAASAAVSKPVAEPAQPQPTESSSEDALRRRGDLLIDLRTWIQALPGITTSGYIDSINDPDAGSTILVWHGPPDRVQRQITDEARRRHIPISVQQRNHSISDLERAARQLLAIESGTGVFQNFTVNSVGTLDIAFDGVTVKGDYIYPSAEGIPAADTALAQTLTTTTGVAVRIEHGQIVF